MRPRGRLDERDVEGDGDCAGAIAAAGGGHVLHALDSVDRLLERRGDRALHRFRIGTVVEGDDLHLRRCELGKLREAGRKAAENFQRVFRDRRAPAEAATQKLQRGPAKKLTALLMELNLAPSKSEAERLIKQGAVEINEERVDDFRKDIDFSNPREFLLRAGKKKFLRIIIE